MTDMRKAFGAVLLLNFTRFTLLLGCIQSPTVCPNPDKDAEYAWIACDALEPSTDAGADADAADATDDADPDAEDDAGLEAGADGG
jgi:hypothetical protein